MFVVTLRSEMDLITLGAAACGGLLLGTLAGFLRGRRAGRRQPEQGPDWKLRLRSRDDDVAAAEARAAEAALALQAASNALRDAERRITELEASRTPGAPPAGNSGLPKAEAKTGAGSASTDDLTLVPGLTPGDAALLAASGITSFEGLAGLGAEGAVVPESVAERLADHLSEWAEEARRLARVVSGDLEQGP